MAGLAKFAALLAIAALAWSSPGWAQTAPTASNLAASAPRTSQEATSRTAGSLARWLCAGGIEMEVRPVSYDGPAKSSEWVVVYKRNGVAYSAERMDRKAAEAFPVNTCTTDRVG